MSLTLSRSTYFGLSDNNSYLLDECTDAQGYIYGTGWCTSIPTTPGAYGQRNAGRKDVMVFKMDPSLGQVIWSTYIGGASDDGGGSIHLAANGDVIVSGYTLSADFPVVGGVGQSYLQSDFPCGFVLRLSSDGSKLVYSSILGRIQIGDKGLQEAARGVISFVNAQDEVYTVAQSVGFNYFITPNAFQTFPSGKVCLVYNKMSSSGTVLYASYYGADGEVIPYDILLVQNSLYICGYTNCTNVPLRYGKLIDAQDAFILRADEVNNNVHPVRCTIFGSGGVDVATAMTYDYLHNRLVICGTAYGSNMPIAASLQLGHNSGGFISFFDMPVLFQGGVTILGQQVVPRSVTMQSTGTLYIGGYVLGTGTTALSINALQNQPQGNIDATLLVLDSSAHTLLYGTYLGGSADDYSNVKVTLIPVGCLLRVLVGLTSHSPNFPTTQDAYQSHKLNGNEDQPVLALFSTLMDERFLTDIDVCKKELHASFSGGCAFLTARWDFGDGSVDSNVTIVRHTYQKPGTYTLRCKLLYSEPDTVDIVRVLSITGPLPVDAGEDVAMCVYETQIQLHASGVQSYQWTPAKLFDNPTSPNPIVKPTTTTTYYVHGIDKNGCATDDSVTVFVTNTKALVSGDTSVCAGSSLTIHAFGGLNIVWIPDSSMTIVTSNDVIVRPKKKTTYRVIVTNGRCTDTASIVVDVKASPQLRMPVPQVMCPGEPTVLHAILAPINGSDTTDALYTWTPQVEIDNPTLAQPTIRATQNRWYYLDVRTPFGCTFRDSVFVTMRTSKSVKVIADSGMCAGEALQLWARGADAYDWQPAAGLDNAQSANPVCTIDHSMDYTVVSTIGPCLDTHRVHIDVHPKPTLHMMADTEICRGTTILLKVLNPDPLVNYQWLAAPGLISGFGPIGQALPLQNTTYIVQAQSSQYCMTVDSVHVVVDSSFSIIVQSAADYCPGEWCTISLLSAYDAAALYTLQPAVAVFDTSAKQFRFQMQTPGVFVVRVTKNQCMAEDSVSVGLKPSASVQSITAPIGVCRGSAAQMQLSVHPVDARIEWLRDGVPDVLLDHTDRSNVQTVALDSSVDFHVHISAVGYCDIDTMFHVEVMPPPTISGITALHGCLGDSVQAPLTCDQAVHVQWSPSDGLSSDTVLQPKIVLKGNQNYTVMASNAAGCSSKMSFSVGVDSAIDIWFRTDTLYAHVGSTVQIGVYARSSAAIPLDRDIVFVMPAAFFVDNGVDSSWVKDGNRYIRIPLRSVIVDKTEKQLATIEGMCLFATSNSANSWVIIDSTETPSAGACTRYHGQLIEMNSSACTGSARGITSIQPLSMRVFPNPANRQLTIAMQGDSTSAYMVEVFDLLGTCVLRQTISLNARQDTRSISLEGLPTGVLMCRLTSRQGSVQQRFVHYD